MTKPSPPLQLLVVATSSTTAPQLAPSSQVHEAGTEERGTPTPSTGLWPTGALGIDSLVNAQDVPPIRPALDSARFSDIVERILSFLTPDHQMRLRVLSRHYREAIDVNLAHHIRLMRFGNSIRAAFPTFKVLDGRRLPLPESIWESQRARNAVRIVDNYHTTRTSAVKGRRPPATEILHYPAYLSALPNVRVFRDLSGQLPNWVTPPTTDEWVSWWGYDTDIPAAIMPGTVNRRFILVWNCGRHRMADASWLTRLPFTSVDFVIIFWLVGHSGMTDNLFDRLSRAIGKAAAKHIESACEKNRSVTLTLVNIKTIFRGLDDALFRQQTFQAKCITQVSQCTGLPPHEACAYLQFLSVDEYKSDVGEERFNLQTQV